MAIKSWRVPPAARWLPTPRAGKSAIPRSSLHPAGLASPLFRAAPLPLEVIESHQDAVLAAPPGSTILARNSHTPVQALAYGPRQFSVQFHPEFTPEILRVLWAERRELLRGTLPFDLDAALDTVRPTPGVANLFANFLDLAPRP